MFNCRATARTMVSLAGLCAGCAKKQPDPGSHTATDARSETARDLQESANAPQSNPPPAWQNNQQLAEAVKNAFDRANVTGRNITIETLRGVCTLEGQMADEEQRLSAERITANVPGVTKVINEIEVAP